MLVIFGLPKHVDLWLAAACTSHCDCEARESCEKNQIKSSNWRQGRHPRMGGNSCICGTRAGNCLNLIAWLISAQIGRLLPRPAKLWCLRPCLLPRSKFVFYWCLVWFYMCRCCSDLQNLQCLRSCLLTCSRFLVFGCLVVVPFALLLSRPSKL